MPDRGESLDPRAFLADNDAAGTTVPPTVRARPTPPSWSSAGDPRVLAELADRVARLGSIRFDEFMDLALYLPDGGFFATGGGAGRATGDFITSPEVGPLFGAVVARYLDRRWHELGRPDPFVVVEAAAGRGALAIAVLAAAPECAPALRYVLVERSAELRARQHDHLALAHPFEVLGPEQDHDTDEPARGVGQGPLCCALEDLPAQPIDGVVLANELLDNVAARLLERADDGWSEVRVTIADGRPAELRVPVDPGLARRLDGLAPDSAPGARLPLQDGAADWVRTALGVLRSGSLVVIDYASTSPELAERPWTEWLRTYRAHERGGHPLDAPGLVDVTCEVAVDQLAHAAAPDLQLSQTEWLRRDGIDELVEAGRQHWERHAHAPDLAAIRARSRAVEAAALTDPSGLGAFRVLEWQR